jgi:hypothetical protein
LRLELPISFVVEEEDTQPSKSPAGHIIQTTNMTDFYRENKTLLIAIAVGLFLLELEIFAVAAMKSGRDAWLQVLDDRGNVIHETDGGNLSSFDKYYFEKTFGPFDQYEVKLVSRDKPFPFRAWVAAAVGVPIGVVLLFGFFVKAYRTLFPDTGPVGASGGNDRAETESRLDKAVAQVSRLNIFVIGFVVLCVVVGYWVVPNVLAYLGQAGLETLTAYKWVFLPLGAVFAGVVIWIIYLRYLLAKKAIDSQTELSKYRLRLEMEGGTKRVPELAYAPQEKRLSSSEERGAGVRNGSDDHPRP